MLNDGVIPEKMALQLSRRKRVLDELCTNDEFVPSLEKVGTNYILHDFVVHQGSKQEIEEKSRVNTENGRRGGRPRVNRTVTEPLTESKPNQNTETETETETHSSTKNEARGTRIDPGFKVADDMRSWARENTPLVNVDAVLPAFIDYWAGVAGVKGVKRDWPATWRNSMRKQQEWAARDAKPTPIAPRDLVPAVHTHKWLADGTCTRCDARRDREDTW
jgi:hypothetical protein